MQKVNYEMSLRNLAYVLGDTINDYREVKLLDTIPYITDNMNYVELEKLLLCNNTSVKKQYLSIMLKNKEIDINRSAFFPSVTFSAGTNYSDVKTANVSKCQQ